PEKVDVCVSEIVGAIGGVEGAARILNEARRFLKPGGAMIPERSITRIAAISLPQECYENPSFSPGTKHYLEKIFDQVGHRFDLRLCLKGVSREDLISDVGVFEELDFTVTNDNPEYDREVVMRLTKDKRLDGFLVWLNLETCRGELLDILDHEHCWLPV